ncbi:glycoside hydrolase family 3 N-terminal domain-containing protein [Rugosimonospora acidiphila]|uniref:Glycoside hydrolase family 3 N-terminal domain-containing protein n=1 Tax=Rugosimonospora acidiphila TaxID=556531 RepID=A0ABP9SIF5_9ACTN
MASGYVRSPELQRLADAVLQPGFEGKSPPPWLLRRLEAGLGGVALFSRNVESREQVAALTAVLRSTNPDVIVGIDEEAGDVTRLEARTGSSRPGNWALGVVDDPDLTSAVARDVGRDLAEAGVTLNYAPDADVNSNPDNPVIGVRSFGADPDLVARHTAAWITGQQSAGVAACAKHFPGHGDTSADSHHLIPLITAGREELERCELVPFRAAIAAGARAVMTGHLLVPAIDEDLPATLSRRVMTDLLRGELGFTGLVVTDGIEMRALTGPYGLAGAAVRALAAGVDAVCVGGDHADERTATALRDAIVDAVVDGRLPEQRLVEAAGRVAELAAWTARQRADLDGHRPPRDAGLGLAAARRAIRLTAATGGQPLPLSAPPHVVELSPASNIAVGDDVPWGLRDLLADAMPDTTGVRLGEADFLDGVDLHQVALAPAGGRPLVVVVRDAHRYEWVVQALKVLVGARDDCVVVETGLAGSAWGAVHVATWGGSLACRQAAAELLVPPGAGPAAGETAASAAGVTAGSAASTTAGSAASTTGAGMPR